MREKIFYVIIENISVIGDDAFARFSNILNVTFSDSFLKVIKQNAFIGCSIKSITFPSSIEFIGDSAFSECSILDLVTFPEQSKLTSISSNTFSQCSNLKSISIPPTIEIIFNSAFQGCSNLESINFPEQSKLSEIYLYAFFKCEKLKSIFIPSLVTIIDRYAFKDCSNLESIVVSKDNGAFSNYKDDGILYFTSKSIESIIYSPPPKKLDALIILFQIVLMYYIVMHFTIVIN